jgi:superfamily II RNA helicase
MRGYSCPTCSEVVKTIEDYLPALYFVFGRKRTEVLAEELGLTRDFLDLEEKQSANRIIQEALEANPGIFGARRQNLHSLLQKGIAYHHAGLAPTLKELIEALYEKRLIYVLFCTETFAVGVNFPAASTVFDSCRKWDGWKFRPLINREFFQMAGRAGRRGYDETGHVFVRIDSRYPEQTGFYNEQDVEPVKSRLVISPNTVLSLLNWKTDEEINQFLEKNLAVYQNTKKIRQLGDELASLQGREKESQAAFCEDRNGAGCQLYRLGLRRELNILRRRKKRAVADPKQRRRELQAALKTPRKECNYLSCLEADKKLGIIEEKKKLIALKKDSLQENFQDYKQEFENVRLLLDNLGYVKGRKLLPRGLFATNIHVQEILITELIFSGLIPGASSVEAAAILAGVDYQPGRDEFVERCPFSLEHVLQLRRSLLKSGVPERFCVWSQLPAALAVAWYEGASFEDLMKKCSLEEGDIFSLLRREIDLLRQIERAAGENADLREFARSLRQAIDRDEIALIGV